MPALNLKETCLDFGFPCPIKQVDLVKLMGEILDIYAPEITCVCLSSKLKCDYCQAFLRCRYRFEHSNHVCRQFQPDDSTLVLLHKKEEILP